MNWLLLLLMLTPAAGFAQTRPIRKKPAAARKKAPAQAPAVRPTRWPIRTLTVEGNHLYTSAEILSIAGLKIGEIAGKDEFDAAHDRLLETGAFATVGYKFEAKPDGKGSDASFQVTEIEVLPARFYELGAPDADLAAWLRARDPLFSQARLASSREVIDRCTKWLQDYLAARKLDDRIMGSVEPWPDQLAIVFRSTKNLPAVAEVSFEGDKAVPESSLRESIAGAAVGAPYTEGSFRLILDASVRPVYEARGMLRVSFPEIRAVPVMDVQGLRVFVTVNEGESYKFAKLQIAGPAPLPPQDLLKSFACKTGDVANFDRVKDGLEKVRKSVRRAGYLDVQVAADRDIHDAEKTVDVAVRVDAGPQYAMGKLTIVGLDLTAEAEMNRIWALKEGKPFDPDYPALFLERVRQEGIFDNLGKTTPATKIDEKTRKVGVTLTFARETPTTPNPARRRP